MGKKYIIELEREETAYKTVNSNGTPLIQLLAPTPYTEPDLEQVRKEAYDRGYDDAKGGYENGFENGMIVAWDAARKIGNMPYGEEENVFGSGGWAFIEKHTATEAIEKLKAYEQEQEEKITKGDIVRIKSAPEIEILVTYADKRHVSGIALTEVDDCCEIGDLYTDIVINKVEKTGGHY